MARLGDSAAALGEPEFRKLFIGQATSVVGSMFRVVALPFAVRTSGRLSLRVRYRHPSGSVSRLPSEPSLPIVSFGSLICA